MRILQVNTFESGGGAEAVAAQLHQGYRREGHQSWLAVKKLRGNDAPECTLTIPDAAHRAWPARALLGVSDTLASLSGRLPGAGLSAAALRLLARPQAVLARRRGEEDFDFPATKHLPDLVPGGPPDILQCHNLHGNYFDLGALVPLSHRLPVVLTLHDCWLMAGHCAHSFACEKWLSGCGECPDLRIYPAIRRDATAFNWRRKRDILGRSRLFVATPSAWLMDRVHRALPGIAQTRVIGNGIDAAFFNAPERMAARRLVGIEPEATVLLFTANTIRRNEWKDFATLRAALERVAAARPNIDLLLIALGDTGAEERIGSARLRFVPFQSDSSRVAAYYAAADLYLHSAKVETFSNTIAEAMACGVPVVANAAGAVPERIRCLGHPAAQPGTTFHDADSATGILTPPAAPDAMAAAVIDLLDDADLRRRLGANGAALAANTVRAEFQVKGYLDWFAEIMERP